MRGGVNAQRISARTAGHGPFSKSLAARSAVAGSRVDPRMAAPSAERRCRRLGVLDSDIAPDPCGCGVTLSLNTMTMSKSRSLALIGVAYVVAVGVAAAWLVWGPATGRLWLDTLIADALATLVVFAFSRVYRNSSFYDAYWSVIPPLLLFYWWSQAGPDVDELRCTLVAVVVVLWAIRLTFNWIRGFPGLHHEDWRYPMFRDRAGRLEFLADLVAIHLIPTVQVFVGMLPVYVAVTRPGTGLPWLAWLAAFIGVAAVVLEFVADQQMYDFAKTRKPGQAMDRGLWSWSRHPNYFGEF